LVRQGLALRGSSAKSLAPAGRLAPLRAWGGGALLLAATLGIGPLEPTEVPLPPGQGSNQVPGLEEVVAVRHADPVLVRRAGSNASFPLDSLRQRERLRSGAWVLTRAGGHAEVFWPLAGTSIRMSEESALRIGEQARDEPAATFEHVSRASCTLQPGVRLALPGGAMLEGDPTRQSGPFVLEARYADVLRFANESKVTALVSYRDEVLPIGPGQSVDLALLDVGSIPFPTPSGRERVEGPGFAVTVSGQAEGREAKGGLLVEAAGRGRARGLGVELELESGQRALFLPLGAELPEPTPDDRPEPETPAPAGI
jgi:hypothetical protein